MGRRLLITGLSSYWGGRLALAFERDPDIEVIVGMDSEDPVIPLERTEFVRCDDNYSILARLVKATQVDTVIHAGLVVDSSLMPDRRIHEKNVIGTMNLLAAAGAEDGRVRNLVVKSSALVYGAWPNNPVPLTEDAPVRPNAELLYAVQRAHLEQAEHCQGERRRRRAVGHGPRDYSGADGSSLK